MWRNVRYATIYSIYVQLCSNYVTSEKNIKFLIVARDEEQRLKILHATRNALRVRVD